MSEAGTKAVRQISHLNKVIFDIYDDLAKVKITETEKSDIIYDIKSIQNMLNLIQHNLRSK